MASDVLAFDVKGYDPGAPLYQITSGGNTSVVSPNDPGFQTGTLIGTGDFVDIGWGRKTQAHFGLSLVSQLSGSSTNIQIPFSDSLYNSGMALQTGNFTTANPPVYSANLAIYQPSFDTWTSRFEGDGYYKPKGLGNVVLFT